MLKIILRHIGITLLGITSGLLNEWIRHHQMPTLRGYVTIVVMTIWFNLYYLPKHWTAKRQFTVSFITMLVSSSTIFWYFEPMNWLYWFLSPAMMAMTAAALITATLQAQQQNQK